MKKEEILVIFENHNRAVWFIEDKLLPLMPYLNQKNSAYESDTFIVKPASLMNENSLRGRSPDLVYLTEECTLKQYNLILQLVKGDHNKIRVVM
jgi:hypothetical protein